MLLLQMYAEYLEILIDIEFAAVLPLAVADGACDVHLHLQEPDVIPISNR